MERAARPSPGELRLYSATHLGSPCSLGRVGSPASLRLENSDERPGEPRGRGAATTLFAHGFGVLDGHADHPGGGYSVYGEHEARRGSGEEGKQCLVSHLFIDGDAPSGPMTVRSCRGEQVRWRGNG